MNKFPTENELPIPNNIGSYENHFASIGLTIKFDTKDFTCPYYLHKCDQVEFQEIPQEQSEYNPETIYFLTSEGSYSTTQPNSNRKELENGEVQNKDTLYFVKEESDS